MQAVYYDPSNPSAGVIVGAFRNAYRRCRRQGRPDAAAAVSRAADRWHATCQGLGTAGEIVDAALEAGTVYGVGDEVAAGLASVGIVEEAKELASKVVGEAHQTARTLIEEGGKTVRSGHETIRSPFEAAGKGAEAAGKGAEAFKGLTQTQMILGGGAIVLTALLLGKALL